MVTVLSNVQIPIQRAKSNEETGIYPQTKEYDKTLETDLNEVEIK